MMFGGVLLWLVGNGVRFSLLMKVVPPGAPSREPIWVIDLLFFITWSIVTGFIVLLGLMAVVGEKFWQIHSATMIDIALVPRFWGPF